MLRGAVLSNTDWIIGMVVYAGHDTKLMKNMGKSKYKQTHIEKTLNKVVIFLIAFQTVLCVFMAIMAADFNRRNKIEKNDQNIYEGAVYLFSEEDQSSNSVLLDALFGFLKFFLLLSSILPISLLVSLEIIKVLQSYWIINDASMYSPEVDQKCKVMSISLNEELGLVNNVFTDKTGTLTANEMIFKACSVAKLKYDKKSIQYMRIDSENSESGVANGSNSHNGMNHDFDDSSEDGDNVLNTMQKIMTLNQNNEEIYNEYIFGNIHINKQTDFLHYFWLALSMCHEVISISKNKQTIVKEHYDDIFMFHGKNESNKGSKFMKKRTFDPKIEKKYTVREE